jgi:hypothetical protein
MHNTSLPTDLCVFASMFAAIHAVVAAQVTDRAHRGTAGSRFCEFGQGDVRPLLPLCAVGPALSGVRRPAASVRMGKPGARALWSDKVRLSLNGDGRELSRDAKITPLRSGLPRGMFGSRAGDGSRTRVTSLEGWGSTVELRPRSRRHSSLSTPLAGKHPVTRKALCMAMTLLIRPGDTWLPTRRERVTIRYVEVERGERGRVHAEWRQRRPSKNLIPGMGRAAPVV